MSTRAIRIRAETLRSLAFGSILSSYVAVGSAFSHAARIIHLQNLTDADVTWSMDGVNDHGVLASGGFILLDLTANKTVPEGAYIAKSTTIYVKSSGSPASKAVHLSVFYGSLI